MVKYYNPPKPGELSCTPNLSQDSIQEKLGCPRKIVCIENTLEKSIEGKYFLGQTETLIIGQGLNAWGGLINPPDSGVILHNTVVTITNFSPAPILAQFWFNSTPPGTGTISNRISPANTAFYPPPQPNVQLQFVQSISGTPTGGVYVISRLVPPQTTLVRDDNGKFIFPPQGSLVIFLASPGSELIEAKMAFGWWEESC